MALFRRKSQKQDIEISTPIEGTFRRGVHISEADDDPGALIVSTINFIQILKNFLRSFFNITKKNFVLIFNCENINKFLN